MYYALLILVVDMVIIISVCTVTDIGLLPTTLSGLKEMLKLCEDYTLKHKIIFNATKSQLLYFP